MNHKYSEQTIDKIRSHFKGGQFKLYNGQRNICHLRVQEIAKFWIDSYKIEQKVMIRGNLVFCKFNDNYYLIDGQHRYFAAEIFADECKCEFTIMCEIITVADENEMFNEFVLINKAVPVPINYLQPSHVVAEIIEWTDRVFPGALGSKKRVPVIAKEYFKDKLTILLSKCKNRDLKAFTNTLIKLEEYLRKEAATNTDAFLKYTAGHDTKKAQTVVNALKIMTNKMHIGLYYNENWMPLFQILNENI